MVPTKMPITEAERRLGEVLESAPDAIVQVDGQGRIVLLNRTAERLFGYTRDELIGQAVEVLVPNSARRMHRGHRAKFFSHPTTRPMGIGLQLEARRKDGSHVPVEISLSPSESESEVRVTAIIRDITQRKHLEDELRSTRENYIRELELRNQAADQANRLKTEFLSNMSHELRSPLQSIIGFAELLLEETANSPNEEQKRFLTHIYRDSQHLLSLINDLLDLSKIEAGRMDLRHEAFDINEVVEEVVESMRLKAEAKALKIQIDISIDRDLMADRRRVKQVFYNLLSNAVKYTPNSGKIAVTATSQENHAEIAISDTGIGIPKDQHEAVFDKFFQIRAAAEGSQQGTGLGLAIARLLVQQQGGKIWIESEPGNGSRFTFTIPLDQSDEV